MYEQYEYWCAKQWQLLVQKYGHRLCEWDVVL